MLIVVRFIHHNGHKLTWNLKENCALLCFQQDAIPGKVIIGSLQWYSSIQLQHQNITTTPDLSELPSG